MKYSIRMLYLSSFHFYFIPFLLIYSILITPSTFLKYSISLACGRLTSLSSFLSHEAGMFVQFFNINFANYIPFFIPFLHVYLLPVMIPKYYERFLRSILIFYVLFSSVLIFWPGPYYLQKRRFLYLLLAHFCPSIFCIFTLQLSFIISSMAHLNTVDHHHSAFDAFKSFDVSIFFHLWSLFI